MMRLVTHKREVSIQSDPKPLDRATWHRVKGLVELEAIHRDWGTALYALHRLGRIDNDQRDAGDRYRTLILDYRKLWRDPIGQIEIYREPRYESLEKRSPLTAIVEFGLGHVVADAMAEESEFETRRAKRIGARYKEARIIAGSVNSVLEAMLIDDVWPVGEEGHINIAHALTRLSHFFSTGTSRKRQNRV